MRILRGRSSRATLPLRPSAEAGMKSGREISSKGKRDEAIVSSEVSQAWVVGAVAMIALGSLFQNKPLFSMGLLLACALAVSWLWARQALRGLLFERKLSHLRAFWGEEVDVSHVFTNGKPLPMPWLAADDQFPGALQLLPESYINTSKAPVRHIETNLSIGWYERVTRHYTIKCTARGEHEFGPVYLQSGDVFGLFRRAEEHEMTQKLLVYPRYVPVEQLGIPARQPFGDLKSALNLMADPLRIRGVREYAVGDSPRFVNWKATARTGVLQTKLFEPSATPQLLIFCDQDTFRRMWEGIDASTLELTITVAASLANHALQEGYMVGLLVNAFAASSDTQVRITPSRSPDQLTRILESLARLRGWSGMLMEDLIRARRRSLPIASTIVVVTGMVSEELLDLLSALRRAGHPVTLVETIGSVRPVNWKQTVAPEAMEAQGIIYYRVENIDKGADIDQISL